MMDLLSEENIIEIFGKKVPEKVRVPMVTRLRSEEENLSNELDLQNYLDEADEEERKVRFSDRVEMFP